ncbi:unnamed protein product, partial [Rotaria magnacalcarata]
MFALILMLLS